jgi:hypothetical protein
MAALQSSARRAVMIGTGCHHGAPRRCFAPRRGAKKSKKIKNFKIFDFFDFFDFFEFSEIFEIFGVQESLGIPEEKQVLDIFSKK